MSNYPASISKEIVTNFIIAHPRGWAVVQQLFYFRDETAFFIFQKDQNLWNKLKYLVKDTDKRAHSAIWFRHSNAILNTLIRKNHLWRDFWRYYKHFQDVFSDEVDYYTYVNVKNEPTEQFLPFID